MKNTAFLAIAAIAALGFTHTTPSHAKVDKNCAIDKPGDEVSYEEAQEVYECLAEKMAKGYNKGNDKKRWVNAEHVEGYRDWTKASTLPANPGFHSERFLLTFVNETGAEAYTKFEEGVTMPVGTVIAKESFSINGKGKAKAGPLFIMEKAAKGKSPRTGDWYYTMVSASGKPQGINVYTACHECHSGFEDSDYLAFPVEEVRAE